MPSTLFGQWLWILARHRAKVTQQFLRQNTPDFIAADEWASYSPDLTPLDYCIWDLQDLVREGRRLKFANLQDLKEAIKNKWKFRCHWISISCSKTCWTYWLICTCRTPNPVILCFCQFGWKVPNHARFWESFEGLTPLKLWVVIKIPKKHIIGWELVI